MQFDHIAFLNKASTSQEKNQAKIAILGQIAVTLGNDEGIKGICEIGSGMPFDQQLRSISNGMDRDCDDYDCAIASAAKVTRTTIALFTPYLDVCADGVDYPNKDMVGIELENYFAYVETVLQYTESM